MFNKLCLFLALVAPLISALSIVVPENPTSGGQVTITWTTVASDEPFSLYLYTESFHDSYAIANNVDPALQQLTITLPAVPVGSSYTLVASNIGDVNDRYSTSPVFVIGASSSGSLSSTPTGSVSVPSVSSRPTSTTRTSSLIVRTSVSSVTSTSTTDTSSSLPTAGSSSGAPRRIEFKIGSVAAAVLAIGGVTVLAL